MERALGITLGHVPDEAGSGAQIAALLGGEVEAIVASLPAALPYVRDGTLAVLGLMATERDSLVPEVPTFRELGFEIVFSGFRALVAPKATPEPIVTQLEQALQEAIQRPEFQDWAERTAIGLHWRDRRETAAYLEALEERVENLIHSLGLKQ